jgi:HK97 family phage portal protein
MGFFRRLFGSEEARAIDKMALWGQGATTSSEVHAGVEVSQDSALRMVTVNRCVRLLSETIAALPPDAFRHKGEERVKVPRPPAWLEFPNPETTWFELVERIVGCLNLDGNAFILITARDSQGVPAELWTLHPRDVVVRRQGGTVEFVWGGDVRLSRFGALTPGGEVLHIKAFNTGGLRGLSPIDQARQAIGLGLVTEKFGAKFFGKGQALSGVIELPPTDPARTQTYVEEMAKSWTDHHAGSEKAFTPGVLTGGARWRPISISPEDAQFLETRQFQVEEIARMFGVPPHMIGHTTPSTTWGTGIEQMSIGFVRFSLLSWIVRLETGLSQLLPRGQFLKLNVKGLLRADAKAEAESFAIAVMNGWQSRAEVRQLLDEPPGPPELEKYLIPANLVIAPTEANPPPTPVVLPPPATPQEAPTG